MLEEAFCDNALGQTQSYEWFKRFKNGWMSVNDEECSWRPSTEPQPKMWHKALKASSIRNLFNQDRRWMENSIVAF